MSIDEANQYSQRELILKTRDKVQQHKKENFELEDRIDDLEAGRKKDRYEKRVEESESEVKRLENDVKKLEEGSER